MPNFNILACGFYTYIYLTLGLWVFELQKCVRINYHNLLEKSISVCCRYENPLYKIDDHLHHFVHSSLEFLRFVMAILCSLVLPEKVTSSDLLITNFIILALILNKQDADTW